MSKKYLVGLDDGHGINTYGKRTVALKEDLTFNGKTRKKGTIIHENEFNEVIMKKVEPLLKFNGINYIELAPTKEDTSLNARSKMANKNKCDIVISIHANALTGNKWQNKAYGLVVIKTKGCQNKTDRLADIMYKHLKKVDFPSNGETKYGVRTDVEISGFTLAILRQTNSPAILIELGFMDNWNDVKVMCSEKFQNECAEGIAKATCEYFGITYKKEEIKKPTSDISTSVKLIKVIVNELNVRNKASWDDEFVVDKVKKGSAFTVISKVKVEGSYMYKLKSGLYITANSKYVEIIK